MNILDELLKVEAKIEELYLILVQLEIMGLVNTTYYNQAIREIFDLTNVEKSLLVQKDVVYDDLRNSIEVASTLPINLGFHTDAPSLRLKNMLDSISGDPGIEYADALNYDIKRILFKFLEYMINNPYYEDIRNDLIYLKYDIIFLDSNMESDFLLQNDMSSISLNSRVMREEVASSKYVDQAILVLEIEEAIKQILNVSNVNQLSLHTLVIIKLMQILSRLALCSEKELAVVMDDVNYLMESEDVDFKIKEIILEMTDIFKQIQSSFYFSR